MIKIELKYIIEKQENNTKIAKILIDKLNVSHRLLTKLKMNEKILVNGTPVFSNYIVHEGDCITIKIDFEEEDFLIAENMNLNILWEDEYFLAVNKPAGIVVHPSANHTSRYASQWCKKLFE